MFSRVCSRRLPPVLSLRAAFRGATNIAARKAEGDISSVFVSLSGATPQPLPQRFADIKRNLIAGHEEEVIKSWNRLLRVLQDETWLIKATGSAIVPEIEYKDIDNPSEEFRRQHKERGVALVRGVVNPRTALEWRRRLREYITHNPQTKAFPPVNPAVFELYWSTSQVQARADPNLLRTQQFLMSNWHSSSDRALISTKHPVSYADRLRIRPPGDSGFALGPHVDGGSCERWEPGGYGQGTLYDSIFQGRWEDFDPWDYSCRLPVVSDLYNGAGACSMFRMYQGWLSMSYTAPGEGTLLVNPLFSHATTYYILRPFFSPKKERTGSEFLDPDNWKLDTQPTTLLQGASFGHTQELNNALHPHLDLENTMVHIPVVEPGDYIAWHCDTIHAVDSVHTGKTDSSVLYIPTCPLTETNADYLGRQREAFQQGAINSHHVSLSCSRLCTKILEQAFPVMIFQAEKERASTLGGQFLSI